MTAGATESACMFRAAKRILTVARSESQHVAPLKYLLKTKRLRAIAWYAESVNLDFIIKFHNDIENF
jgi:hypothetical protein